MTAQPSTVRTLLTRLALNTIHAEWTNTGGNCMAVEVPLPTEGSYLLITDLEGPLTHADLDSDDERYGWSVYRYDAADDGEPADAPAYLSPAEGYAGPATDIDDVIRAVRDELAR